MGRRTLQASSVGIKQIKASLKKKRWTQDYLGGVVGCSRTTIWSLLNVKPIDCEFFQKICSELGLNWEDIAESELDNETANIDNLVQEVRAKIKPLIQERCGTMRVLDMTQPIGLNDIYTSVNILETITGRKRLKIEELFQQCTKEDFDRFGMGKISIKGLDALLKKWDSKRGIQREQIYKKLSVQRKEDLLSKIALTTFEQSDYFFKQKAAEKYIIEYIRNLPDANNDPEALQLDSEKILKLIEAQHGLLVERAKGIYSFSHLTFHEYFTAREFVLVQQSSDDALQSLVSHFTEKRWREVCLLAVGMSPNADRLLLLIKDTIDRLVSEDEKLQQFLIWVKNKSLSVQGSYKPAAVRALYFVLYLDHRLDNYSLDLYLHLDLNITIDPFFDLDISLYQSLDFHLYLKQNNSFDHEHTFSRTLDLCLDYDLSRTLDPKLNDSLQQLKEQIPDRDEDIKGYMNWWKTNSQAWNEELRNIMIKYRNIGHDWQFSEEQKELLQKYHDANNFLLECLNSDCYVSRDVRQYIEDTLLLPIAEIKPYR
ncbi:MAG: hypothetical protein HEQ13_17455 [Dolichospermum sp. DEX189]|nr:hypothetical protein [Dolichospermum sp. DEX189]